MTSWSASTHQNVLHDSYEAGQAIGRSTLEGATMPVRGVMVYFSLLHDATELFRGLRDVIGSEVPVIGASCQGVVGRNVYEEEGLFCGALAWMGDLEVDVSMMQDIHLDTFDKGVALGRAAASVGEQDRRISILLYDPLGGVNARALLRGFDHASAGTTLVGGAAAGPFGPMVETLVVCGDCVTEAAAVMMTIGGRFSVLTAKSTGTIRVGTTMVVTKVEDNRVLELDHRSAVDVWSDGVGTPPRQSAENASWAIGVERETSHGTCTTVLAPFFLEDVDGLFLQSDISVGSRIVFHQRAPEVIFEGTRRMVADLAARRGSRTLGALLTFECGARTAPFLGSANTVEENRIVQAGLTDEHTPWLGLLAWGEIAPCGGTSEFFNYTYPIAMLCHEPD